MKNLKVSIIVPVKNEEANLPRLVKSANEQTYKNLEVIVVDTGSTDQTVKIAKSLGVKIFEYGAERSAGRNYGAEKATGKYLLFLDADMQLSKKVIQDCVDTALKTGLKVLTIPEVTVGTGFFTKIRKFERQMYLGDPRFEVARFFDAKVFKEFGGYDLNLTGPEDYDLPYRISKKYKIGRTGDFIYHHEANVSLWRLLKKKYYYANRGAVYAKKHPELVKIQGNLLFRKAYLTHWKNFVKQPLIGISFLIVRFLETSAAVFGYTKAVGISGFLKTFLNMFIS